MLSLVSLAHMVPCEEALHPALQTRVPGAKNGYTSTSARRAVCTIAARDTTIQDGGGGLCAERLRTTPQSKMAAPGAGIRSVSSTANPARTPASPCWWDPYKAALSVACWERMLSRGQARTSPFFDQRIKLSFASKPNSVASVGSNYTKQEDPCWGPIREGL